MPAIPELRPSGPLHLPMDELLRLADAFPLLEEYGDLIQETTPEASRETVFFAILDALQEHLDETRGLRGPLGVHETIAVIREWFTTSIAEQKGS